MAKTVADVMKMVKDNEVKFVDFRFTDTRGKEQHVSVPVSHFDEDKFSAGHAFDGSSIAGWKGIEASDMLLMPDPNTANIDPFFEEPTLILTCDVIEPGDGKPYERDPRAGQARRGLHEEQRPGRHRLLRPGARVLHLRPGALERRHVGLLRQDRLRRGAWSTGKDFEGGNMGHRPAVKGGYFPVPPVDSFQDMRSEMCLILEQPGHPGRGAPPRGGQRRPERDRHQVQHAGPARRLAAAAEVRDPQRGARLRQDGHLHAQAHRRRQRQRHARAPVGLEGRQEPVRRRRLRRPERVRAVLHRRHHQARPRAERHHQPRHQQLQAPGARLRGPGQAGLLGAQPLGLDPHPVRGQPQGPPHRGALPRSPDATRTWASRRC
jgi:hypothetical protein